MSKKKHHHEEHEEHVNHEAWVIPYADMLTLLMALFLVMWATSQTDVNKMKQVSAGFADSLGIVGNGQGVGGDGILEGAPKVEDNPASPDITPKSAAAFAALDHQKAIELGEQAAKEQLDEVKATITATAQAAGNVGELAFRDEGRGLVVSIVSEGVLFDAGSADLRPEGRKVLDGLAVSLGSTSNSIVIEGHTDDRPISTTRFRDNWDLSTARAVTVLNYLTDVHRMPSSRFSASGYGDQKPAADNADPSGRAKNRRVDIAILSDPAVAQAAEAAAPATDPVAETAAETKAAETESKSPDEPHS